MALPIVHDPNQNLNLIQQKWKAKLDPIFSNPNVSGKLLTNVNLNNGSTQIPHGLGGVPKGWRIEDITGPATIYRSAPFDNQNLTLTSSAAVTVNIWVY